MEAVIQETISLIFSRGVRLEWLIKLLGLDIIDIKMSLLKPYDHYFIFFVTPIFNLNKLKREQVQNISVINDNVNNTFYKLNNKNFTSFFELW